MLAPAALQELEKLDNSQLEQLIRLGVETPAVANFTLRHLGRFSGDAYRRRLIEKVGKLLPDLLQGKLLNIEHVTKVKQQLVGEALSICRILKNPEMPAVWKILSGHDLEDPASADLQRQLADHRPGADAGD